MRKPIALLLGTLLPLLGLSGIGQAQSSVQVQGIIQSVDCPARAVVLRDAGSGALNTIVAAPYTPVLVGTTSVAFCTLEQYIGAPASVWLVASGSEFVATRIDILGPAVAAPPPVVGIPQPVPVPEPAPAQDVSPLPIVGIVLGTIIVAGLVYLLTRDRDGRHYRYPYYGAYYHHYYRPQYGRYLGPVPGLAPIVTIPPVIAGPVLGTCAVGGLDYLVARDRDGRFYRYPYYGPYRQHYYRPEYRAYYGPYRDAPVRDGDPRWGGPVQQNVRLQGPPPYPDPGRAPAWQGAPPPQWNHDPRNTASGPQAAPPRWTPPAVQNAPAPHNGLLPTPNDRRPQWSHDPHNTAPGPQAAPPRWTPPAVQNAPAPHNGPPQPAPNDRRPQWNHDPRNTAPGPQWNHDPRNNASGPQAAPSRWNPPATTPRQSCETQAQNHPCGVEPKR
jgi:hypothetical protein